MIESTSNLGGQLAAQRLSVTGGPSLAKGRQLQERLAASNPSQQATATPVPLEVSEEQVADAQEVQRAFADFFGQTFFSQMIKAMRQSERPPAYFHGGQTEEIFRSQLDQQLSEELADATAVQLAEPMFEQQFPRHAAILRQHAASQSAPNPPSGLESLAQLRRR